MEKLSVNGITLAYDHHGNGNPLVLIHGFPLDRSIWDEVIPLLESQFDLIVPDLRGFGGSSTVNSAYTVTDMADDLAALLDHLRMKRVALAGHSMGGYVALAFARKYADRVSGLALVSSQAAGDTQERKDGRYKTAQDVAQKGVGVVAEAMTPKLSADERLQKIVQALIERQSKEGVIGGLKAMAEREDLTAQLSTFKFPLVIVHGDADALIPLERAQEIKSLVPSAKFTKLQGVGHLPMIEAPGKTAKALEDLK
jgi:pimeloyl-ACP methyl ester carboxylesterase